MIEIEPPSKRGAYLELVLQVASDPIQVGVSEGFDFTISYSQSLHYRSPSYQPGLFRMIETRLQLPQMGLYRMISQPPGS